MILLLTNSVPLASDVSTQSNLPGWTLGKWAEYYDTEPEKRDKIRNVISLEISGTDLAEKVLPPRIVRELDWVDKFWPNTKKGRGHTYPKVQLYCLMGVANAWTVRILIHSSKVYVSKSFARIGMLISQAPRSTTIFFTAQRSVRY